MRKKLIEIRKQKGLTQNTMSKLLGVARTTYSGYELGSFTPSLDVAINIKKILKHNNDDIFTDER